MSKSFFCIAECLSDIFVLIEAVFGIIEGLIGFIVGGLFWFDRTLL